MEREKRSDFGLLPSAGRQAGSQWPFGKQGVVCESELATIHIALTAVLSFVPLAIAERGTEWPIEDALLAGTVYPEPVPVGWD